MRREDLKKVKSREECIYLVAYTRPTASGMTFRTRDKNCWAEFGTTGTNGHNGYESCKFNRNFYQINFHQFHNSFKCYGTNHYGTNHLIQVRTPVHILFFKAVECT